MANYLISYPRSGRTWLETRIGLFLYRCMKKDQPIKAIDQFLVNSHFGYDAYAGPHRTKQYIGYTEQDTVTILLRNPKAILTSYYHYVHNVVVNTIPTYIKDFVFPNDINGFVYSLFGVDRLCRYLNDFHNDVVIHNRAKIKYLYYLDAFESDFINYIPEVLGIDYKMSDQDVEFINYYSNVDTIRNKDLDINEIGQVMYDILMGQKLQAINRPLSSLRKGIPDSYKEELSLLSCEYVDNYIDRYCILEEYRKRYV